MIVACCGERKSDAVSEGKVTTVIESQYESKYLRKNKLSTVFYDQKIWSIESEDFNGDGKNDNVKVYSTMKYRNNSDEPSEYFLIAFKTFLKECTLLRIPT